MANDLIDRDPIVEEVRRIREERAARLNFDIAAIVRDARKRERRSGHTVVSFARKTATRR